jgi:DNA-binding response OmpR family regulator
MTEGRERILVVEDERDLVKLLRYNLERERFAVIAGDLSRFLEAQDCTLTIS